MTATTALLWVLALPLMASPVIYLFGRLGVRRGGTAVAGRWLSLAALAATAVPLSYAGQAVLAGQPVGLKVGAIGLRMDGVGLLLAGTVLTLTTFVTIFSIPYMAREDSEEKYYALLPAMMAAMIGLGSACDLFNLWVWFEAMAITSYLLVAFYNRQRGALEAGVKYLVQSAVGSALVLLGIALVFAQTGTLDLAGIRAAITGPTPQVLLAGALFLVGFGVKAAIVPLHTWLPDAHSQA
ncbi:MAG: hypothetical protein IMZ67_09760, partial [Acidobacteria bacterium]|nr:hypothetical protein [Acidobacteriota bacterium]